METTNPSPTRDYDVAIVGAGTAGMESALSLGDMGYKVLLIEKQPSIGGRTILLSKVFPTLDCASCITTPKMSATANHPMVELMSYSEVDGITKNGDGSFHVKMHKKPTYVDQVTCTGCGQCEEVCTVPLLDEYNYNLIARRAAHIPFPQAVPKKAVISRSGFAPCMGTCPAGVKPSGYISLVRAGRIKEGFELHLEDAPLVGSLSRVCYAPCEGECTREKAEGPLKIRGIKRFMADWYYERYPKPLYGPPKELKEQKIAVVGSGPAGLCAAYHLARKGYPVTVFESAPQAGGILRYGIPSYRMPNDVLDRDILNVTALGVDIQTSTRVESLADLKKQGYSAIYLAVGNHVPRVLPIDGDDFGGSVDCMSFLRDTKVGSNHAELEGKNVIVLGGGNAAIDVARAAIRLKPKSVTIVYRRTQEEMPAHTWEIKEALEEGVNLLTKALPANIEKDADGQAIMNINIVEKITRDENGQTQYTFAPGGGQNVPVDVLIPAIGLNPGTAAFAEELTINSRGIIEADDTTGQTSDPVVFAGGDAAHGASNVTEAMGHGRRSAFYMDRLLQNLDLDEVFDDRSFVASKDEVMKLSCGCSTRPSAELPQDPPQKRILGFDSYEGALTEEQARLEANRCLGCGECSQCQECVKACPADCIDFSMLPEHKEFDVGTVIVSTGYEILDPGRKELLGYDRYPNVISGPQMDRLLAPTRPYNGVLRPSDGKEPDNIAIVLCNGSRDHTVCNPLCCRIGCMYSVKHAQLIMGALPMADITIYTIDVRAFGKGYDEFYEQSKAMGVQYVRGKVARIDELDNGNLSVHYENIAGGGMQTMEHDLVVLTVGFLPNTESLRLYKGDALNTDEHAYIKEPDEIGEPAQTNIDGLFVAGTVVGVRDIPDTVLHAGAASAQAAAYIEKLGAIS